MSALDADKEMHGNEAFPAANNKTGMREIIRDDKKWNCFSRS